MAEELLAVGLREITDRWMLYRLAPKDKSAIAIRARRIYPTSPWPMKTRLGNDVELWFIVSALCFAVVLSLNGPSDPAARATLVGALLGIAAVLLGNWLNRTNERRRVQWELDDRQLKLKALIAAELIDVVIGLMGAKELCRAAQFWRPAVTCLQ